jgi:hypothetical protein
MIINLTQHPATSEQLAAGVVDMKGSKLEALKDALTFDSIPSRDDIAARAEYIAELAAMYDMSDSDDSVGIYPRTAMIGGAPFLMSALESALMDRFISPLYAFSVIRPVYHE